MASRTECDASFREIGFPRFSRQPSKVILDKVQVKKSQLEPKSASNSNLTYLLNNAVRCNSICSDSDSEQTCSDKITNYFDQVKSVERCHTSAQNCFYLLKPIPEVQIIQTQPIYPKTRYFDILMNKKYQIYTWQELSDMFPDVYDYIQIPNNFNHENLLYLADSDTLKTIQDLTQFNSIQLTPRGKTAIMSQSGRQCNSPCTRQIWGRWPFKRYGCWLNQSTDDFDWCDPNQ